MANSMTGRVHLIMPTETIVSKKDQTKTFAKRTIVLDCTRFDPYTGERDKFENFPSFEFTGDKVDWLNSFNVGDVVTISFDLQGTAYTGADGKEKYFTSIRAYKIEKREKQESAEQPKAELPKTETKPVATSVEPQPNDLPF